MVYNYIIYLHCEPQDDRIREYDSGKSLLFKCIFHNDNDFFLDDVGFFLLKEFPHCIIQMTSFFIIPSLILMINLLQCNINAIKQLGSVVVAAIM